MKTAALNDNRNSPSLLPVLTAILLVIAGIVLRVDGLRRFLIYDEIWTVCHYVPLSWKEIFTDLATPNNHCLNSLLIKWSMGLFDSQTVALRLPALIFGLLTLFLVYRTAKNKIHTPSAVIFAVSWVSFSAFLVFYSHTARGYSFQAFFVLTFFLLLLNQRKTQHPRYTALLLFFSAAGACLSVTSGIIFICSFGVAYLLCLFPWKNMQLIRKSQVPLIIAGVLFLLFAALWYGRFYTKLKEGQQFGVEIRSFLDFLRFCFLTLHGLRIIPLVLLTAAGIFLRKRNPFRRVCACMLVSCGFVLLSALFTKAGPERVYLALIAPFSMTAAMTFSVICRQLKRPAFTLLFCLVFSAIPPCQLSAGLEYLHYPCCDAVADQVMAETPKNVLIVYSRADGIPVMFNCPDSLPDMEERLSGKGSLTGLLVLGNPSALETMNEKGENIDLPMNGYSRRDGLISGWVSMQYDLAPLRADDDVKENALLITVSSLSADDFRYLMQMLQTETTWRLNPVFSGNMLGGEKKSVAFFCEAPSRSSAEYLKMTELLGNKVQFYRFIKTTERK